MKELKSKKTGRISIYTDEEYAAMVNKGTIPMNRFTVTDLKVRSITPREAPREIKKKKE